MAQPGWGCGGVGKAASLQSRRGSVSLLKRPLVHTLLLWDRSVWNCLKPFQGPHPLRKEGEELRLSDFRADLLCATPGLWGGHQRSEPEVGSTSGAWKLERGNQSFIGNCGCCPDSQSPCDLPKHLSLHLFPHRFTLPQSHFLRSKHPTVYLCLAFALLQINRQSNRIIDSLNVKPWRKSSDLNVVDEENIIREGLGHVQSHTGNE